MQSRIVVTRRIPDSAVELLRSAGDVHVCERDQALEPAELHEVVRGAHGVVTMLGDRVDDELVTAAGPQLQVVANVAVGYDNVDVPAVTGRGVTVTNTPGVLTDATADLGFGLLLMATRRLGEGERLIRSGQPWFFHLGFMLGTGLQGKTLGIIGLGGIGQAMARRARAFGMNIAYAGRRRAAPEVESELDARYLSQDELLREADALSLHCPLTEQTRHLIDESALAKMKPSAVLINTSRGPVVDEKDLAAALLEGLIAAAGLDVFEREPSVEHALLELDNAV
ncbi:MAG: D-glycerate dehydrogenase, partial [Saccharopolyspora sp.]|uniref:2-hydroxyacid dehydrogenase n=1 Tax=Saccharopolyspora sp. TaxID=33915 RepID=UPI0025E53203